MTRLACAAPMTFYSNLVMTLIAFKVALVLLLAAAVWREAKIAKVKLRLQVTWANSAANTKPNRSQHNLS